MQTNPKGELQRLGGKKTNINKGHGSQVRASRAERDLGRASLGLPFNTGWRNKKHLQDTDKLQ